jgi:NAD(P)-dependent dehydrogenase (short-subunit alcohol dehydrogenase family)
MQLKALQDQVVVLMGASSGIGREAAARFAARGAKVVVSARGAEGLALLVEEIGAAGGVATAIPADASDPAAVQAVADGAVAEHGRLDTWVHLAAVALWATFEDTTVEEFHRVVEVDLLGQVHGAKAALPHLRREGRGALVHVSSIEAKRAFPLHSAYAAAKHGVHGFLEALRVELRHEGVPIAVTEVLPATIDTPIFDDARTKIGRKPMGAPPFYDPGTVADMLLYAAEHGGRDVYAGGAARFLALQQRLSPRMLDAVMSTRLGWRMMMTSEPKSEHAPDNLYGPIVSRDVVRDGFPETRHSASNWMARQVGAAADRLERAARSVRQRAAS